LYTVFIFAYLVYLVASVCVYMFVLRVKCTEIAFFGLLASMLIPPFGLLFAFTLRCSEKQAVHESDTRDAFTISPLTSDVEKLRVPMGEALVLNDRTVCCALLMDALKNDPLKYLAGIREALAKGDPETAHYAAAAVMDIQKNLLNQVRLMSADYQKQKHGENMMNEYVDILKKSLESRLFDSYNESRLQASLEEVLDFMIANNPTPEAFSERTELAIKKRDYREALKYAGEYLSQFPEEENAYLYCIQCLTSLRDAPGLRDFIGNLNRRPVRLTAKTLPYIRYLRDTGIVV